MNIGYNNKFVILIEEDGLNELKVKYRRLFEDRKETKVVRLILSPS